jgi:hypothetical protein
MKKNFIIFPLMLLLIYSCEKRKTPFNKNYKVIADKTFQKLSKTPDDQLTKIEFPTNINLDTIESDHKVVNFTIKNVGKKNLHSLFIKPPCSCIEMPKYDTVMLPNTEQNFAINMSFNQLGNFYVPITVYGNFYPFKKIIFVEGYRRK